MAYSRNARAFGECSCGLWGYAPKEFKESKHFLKCSCGKAMYLIRGMQPMQGINTDQKEITPGLIEHGEKV